FALEVASVVIAANTLNGYGHADWTVAAVAFIVGAFFFPLAARLEYPLYAWTGAVELILCAGLAYLLRSRLNAADPVFGLVMGLSLWITVVVTLAQASRWSGR